MKGGFIHNHILLSPIANEATRLGMHVTCEAPIRVQNKVFFGDLLIQSDVLRILVETEMSPRRVENDLVKAAALNVSELWIVVPHFGMARLVRWKLSELGIGPEIPGLFVLVLPQAIQRLRNFYQLNSVSDTKTEKKKKMGNHHHERSIQWVEN